MKVYVVTSQVYDDGNEYFEVHGVFKSLKSAKEVFDVIRDRRSDWLATHVDEEDFEIEFESERGFSAYDSCTGDYNFEVIIHEEELED